MRALIFVYVTLLLPASLHATQFCGPTDIGLSELHPSSESYQVRTVRDQAALLRVSRSHLAEISRTNSSRAEIESIHHQADVGQYIGNRRMIERLRLDRIAMELGVHNSDMGKLAVYKKLLLEPSFKSDLLIDVLRGERGYKSSEALGEFLKEVGFEGRTLLNRNFTNAEIRQIFKEVAPLSGFLHALPGMADAFMAYEAGAITKAQFKKQIGANLFHNGPAEGFWKLIQDVFIPGAMAKANPKAKQIFDGTVYQNARGKLEYPYPQTAEGVFHTIGDRLSQATRSGVVKIYHEIIGFSAPTTAAGNLLLINPRETVKQMDALIQNLATRQANPYLTKQQISDLTVVAKEARQRIVRHIEVVDSLVQNAEAIRSEITANPQVQLPSVTIAGKTIRLQQVNTEAGKLEVVQYLDAVLKRVESQTGNPMNAVGPEIFSSTGNN